MRATRKTCSPTTGVARTASTSSRPASTLSMRPNASSLPPRATVFGFLTAALPATGEPAAGIQAIDHYAQRVFAGVINGPPDSLLAAQVAPLVRLPTPR